LVAFGCTPYGGGQADPLLIRWSNQDDPGNWTPEITTVLDLFVLALALKLLGQSALVKKF
jgi:hypothetical protein